MAISKAEAEREMDSLVRELYGLVPETPVETEMQKLRQRVADGIAVMQAEQIPVSDTLPMTQRGIQAGNIGAFEVILKWIDEIAEGDCEDHNAPD